MLEPIYDGQLRPTLYCIGQVAEVDSAKVSEKGYLSAKVTLSPSFTGRKATTWVIIGPGALNTKNKLTGFAATNYAQNVNRALTNDTFFGYSPATNARGQYVGLALLPGLCGSKEKWLEFAEKLEDLSQKNDHLFTDEFIAGFDELMQTLVGKEVGYILKQQWVATEELNERGYPIRVPGEFYEVSGMFYTDRETLEKIQEAVERWNNSDKPFRAVCTFEVGLPF
jgi:hypothetical protein